MKPNTNLTLADHRLLDLVWQAEPVSSPQLCKLAEEALGWKRTTTYTVIKRLCGKGCLKNENAIVTSLVDRATVQQADGQEVLQRSFNGSLPTSWPPSSGPVPSATRRPPSWKSCWKNTKTADPPDQGGTLWMASFPHS